MRTELYEYSRSSDDGMKKAHIQVRLAKDARIDMPQAAELQ